MNKFLGLLLTATFLVSLSSAQAMDEEHEFHSMTRQLEAKVNSLVLDGAQGNEDKGHDALKILAQIERAICEGDERAILFFDQADYYKGLLKDFGFEQQNNAEPSSSLLEIPMEDLEQVQLDHELAQALQKLDMQGRSPRVSHDPQIIEGTPEHKINFHPEYARLYNDFDPMRAFFGPTIYERAKIKDENGQDSNVHIAMDPFYLEHVTTVLGIADTIFPENGILSLKETADSLKKFLQERPDLLANYSYEGKQVDLATMETMIDGVYQDDMNPALCSHTFNLARQLFDLGREDGMHRLIDAISENSLTGGGCLDGRRDRQLRELCTMLMHNGLGE